MKTIILLAILSSTVFQDTTVYDTPECWLWYVRDLPIEYRDKPVAMWTEHAVYQEGVQAINVFVSNPKNVPLSFGRYWELRVWNGSEWVPPRARFSPFIWRDDEFVMPKGMLLHCFRFPVGSYYHLPKGKYRVSKSFYARKEEMKLSAEFEIK